jgi:hypothetical protein
MARKKRGPVHRVSASLQVPQLTRSGSSLRLEIYAGDQKIGEIVLGRGSMTWKGRKRLLSKRIPWSRFAEMMDELAYG